MKCSACSENKCEGKYENRELCLGDKEGIDCNCSCRVSLQVSRRQKAASIFAGAATVAAGVGLTVMTGGLAAIVGGAAIVGAGSSLVLTPIQKTIANEAMTLKDSGKDVLLGGTIGALTGPIGAGGSALAKGATGLARVGIRVMAGSGAGAVSGAVAETARYMQGEEVTLKSVSKSIGVGAAVGAIGGTSAHLASSASSTASSELTKAVTRVGVQTAAGAATDAGLQYAQTGTVDLRQTMLNTTGQLVVGATAEASSAAAQRTNAYATKVNNQLIDEDVKAKKISPETGKELKEKITKINKSGDIPSGKKIGKDNVHVLEDRSNSKRGGQVAFDVGSKNEDGSRGGGRGVTEKINGKYIYVDSTSEHDYKGMRDSAKGRISNPIEGLRTGRAANGLETVEMLEEEDEVELNTDKEKLL